VLKTAYANYDLENTIQLITGGDGNCWVRRSFDRLEINQVFQLVLSQIAYDALNLV